MGVNHHGRGGIGYDGGACRRCTTSTSTRRGSGAPESRCCRAPRGARPFLRVGPTGAIQDGIALGDVVVTTGAVRLDGASTHYAPLPYPAGAHHEGALARVRAA